MARKNAGRPTGLSTARQDILDAAVHLFAERGFDRTTLRAVTDAAGCDVALVTHYFGGKEGLFDEAVTRHSDTGFELLDALRGSTPPDAATVADTYLRIWETEPTADVIKAQFRAALESENRRKALQRLVAERLGPVSAAGGQDAGQRVQLLAAHLMGVGVMRYILKFSPVADLSHEEMVADLTPVIERYLP